MFEAKHLEFLDLDESHIAYWFNALLQFDVKWGLIEQKMLLA